MLNKTFFIVIRFYLLTGIRFHPITYRCYRNLQQSPGIILSQNILILCTVFLVCHLYIEAFDIKPTHTFRTKLSPLQIGDIFQYQHLVCIYLIFNHAGAHNGWAIPMATDIAFALGVLSLLGNRVPNGVRVFFSTLAIADDLISIAAIAIFYGQSPNPFWLGAAALVTCALVWLNRTQHYRLAPYSVLGLLLWFCMFKSGVHATLAGVILAFTIPAKCGVKLDSLTDWLGECLPLLDDRYDDEAHILGQHDFTVSTTKVERVMHRVTPPLIRMERLISTPVNFVILPIFAFVNAQVRLVGVDMSTLLTDPVTLGVYFGMLLGKPIGIFGMTFALVKLKISELPRNVNWHMIAGVGILGGIGFTMSILISGLAFPTAQFEVLAAKAAILAGSVTAAVLGMIYMSVVCKHPAPKDE